MGNEAYGGNICEIFQCKGKAGQAEGNISATLEQFRAKWIYGGAEEVTVFTTVSLVTEKISWVNIMWWKLLEKSVKEATT